MLKKFLCTMLSAGMVTAIVWAHPSIQSKPLGDATATPEAQTLKIYRAFRDQDYKALFYLIAFTPQARVSAMSADTFAADMQRGYEASFKTPEERAGTDKILRGISDIMIGEPVITGTKAAVPTSAKITGPTGVTITFRGQANLIKEDGVWKLDLTFTDDTEKAMAQRTAEIFGNPEVKKGPPI